MLLDEENVYRLNTYRTLLKSEITLKKKLSSIFKCGSVMLQLYKIIIIFCVEIN